MFKKSPKMEPKGKKTLKEIEADLEAKTGNEDLDDPNPSQDEIGGESAAPWKTIVSDDATVRYSKMSPLVIKYYIRKFHKFFLNSELYFSVVP